ncbi:hypothetical protein ACFQDL_22030 [Marinobacterium aestuariivivens]|uniref:VCBS repeat-containing protein n=1 Tax=Marinobacterium aestuariivivens TaxID=1698799 RepID=A0ABW2A532_9GAMM
MTEVKIFMEYYNNFVPFEITGIDNIALISDDPIPITLSIDIKPGSDPNCVNTNDRGVIPVAILGSDTFDVNSVDVRSLVFAGLAVREKVNETPQCGMEDVNGDGFIDLVCQYADDTAYWAPNVEVATLTGLLLDGTEFDGTDSICIVP